LRRVCLLPMARKEPAQRGVVHDVADALLNKFLIPRITGVALDDIVPLKVRGEVCRRRLSDSRGPGADDGAGSPHAIRTPLGKVVLSGLWPAPEPVLYALDSGLVAAYVRNLCGSVLACPQLGSRLRLSRRSYTTRGGRGIGGLFGFSPTSLLC